MSIDGVRMVAAERRAVVAGGAVGAGEGELGDGRADDLADAAPAGVGDVDGCRRRSTATPWGAESDTAVAVVVAVQAVVAAAAGDDGDGGAGDLPDAVAAGVGDVHVAVRRGDAERARRASTAVAVVVLQAVVPPPPATAVTWCAVTLADAVAAGVGDVDAPEASTATSEGADSETPAVAVVVVQVVVAPPPATRVTLPAVSTLRMQLAPVSAM